MEYNELIDYFESKNMNSNTINTILLFIRYKTIDVTKVIDDVYNIFSYAGLNNEQIEMFIIKNINVLELPKEEIIKIAYVLYQTDLIDELFSRKSVIQKLKYYKRIFMRNLVAKYSGRYVFGLKGINFLTCDDFEAYGSKFNLSSATFRLFGKYIFSDDDLELALNKKLLIDNKKFSVEEYINKKSLIFYKRYLDYKKLQLNKGEAK